MKTTLLLLFILCQFSMNAQWNHIDVPTTDILTDCNFGYDQTGYVEDDQAEVWKTTNQGNQWTWIHSNHYVFNMNFISADTGFAVNDSCIYKTSDGGLTWNSVWTKDSTLGPEFRASYFWFFPDKETAFCFYYDAFYSSDSIIVLKSTDRGNNWSTISHPTVQNNGIINPKVRIMFVDSLTGFLSNGTSIAKTTDGGITWNIFKVFIHGVQSFFACSSDTVLSASIMSDTLYRTTDNGQTWHAANKTVGGTIFDMWFTSKDTGYMCGGDGFNGYVAKTTDAGANWSVDFTESRSYYSLSFPSKQFAYVAGDDGKVLRNNLNVGIDEWETYIPPAYPNPASTVIKLPSIPNVTYSLFDLSGRCVIRNCKDATMNVIGLEKGLYILGSQSDSKTISCQKIVIQ